MRRIALTRWLDRLRRELGSGTGRNVADDRISNARWSMALCLSCKAGCHGERPRHWNLLPERIRLAFACASPDPDDHPPTLFSNPRPIAGAEGAVTFFMTPGYRAWDPTWVMFFSFAAFFAMILADAGYGLVLGVILAFVAKRLGRTESGRRFRQLAVFMVRSRSVTVADWQLFWFRPTGRQLAGSPCHQKQRPFHHARPRSDDVGGGHDRRVPFGAGQRHRRLAMVG